MFSPPSEVLKSREGSLEQVPLPALLHAILLEERTCALELKQRQLEKRISFEEGVPVGCTTNLLHETLGRYLVEKQLLPEAAYHAALSESVRDDVPLQDLLVKKGLISAFDLYKQMQANLAHTLLDCFRWADARYRLVMDAEPCDKPVRMNAVQLILTGVNTMLPFDTVATHLAFVDEQRFALPAKTPHSLKELKLATKDVKLLQVLRSQPNFAELGQKSGLETEALMRRLYGLATLGFVDFAENVSTLMAESAVPADAPPEPTTLPPRPPAGIPFADQDEALRNELVEAFMSSRGKDPFELLGITHETPIVGVRRAFLELATRHAPVLFATADLKEKAEAMLVAYARAWGELTHPEQREGWMRRKKGGPPKRFETPQSAAAQMVIKHELLDAHAQLEKGLERLATDDFKGALAFFEYACDIEPKALHQAYRGWARFRLNPAAHKKLAISELEAAVEQEADCDLALFFIGEIGRVSGDLELAENSYRRAFKVNPKQRKYSDLIRAILQEKKVTAKGR